MFAAMHHITTINKLIDGCAQISNRFINTLLFFRRVIRNEIGNHNAWLMQHRITQTNPVRQRLTGKRQGARKRNIRSRMSKRFQLTGGNDLGEHHRGGLQRLDFLIRIKTVRAVLNNENAKRIAGT